MALPLKYPAVLLGKWVGFENKYNPSWAHLGGEAPLFSPLPGEMPQAEGP